MTRKDVLRELNGVFVRVFERPDLSISEATTAADVRGWDSIRHVDLIAAIEMRFELEFTLREVMQFRNVGDMCSLIHSRLVG
jgi:acyl carrier protein